MCTIVGGTYSNAGAASNAVTGGIGAGVGAATTAVTLSALAVPILCGAIVGLTCYLVREAFNEGALAYDAYQLAN